MLRRCISAVAGWSSLEVFSELNWRKEVWRKKSSEKKGRTETRQEMKGGNRTLAADPREKGLSSKVIHYGNTIALSGIMERRGEEEAMRARAVSSVMLMLFSWTEAVLRKNPASNAL